MSFSRRCDDILFGCNTSWLFKDVLKMSERRLCQLGKLWILIFSEILSMFKLWPSGDANPIVNSGIGLIDVDLSLVFDGVCGVTGKIGSVSSVEVLNEMLLWGVSENYYYLEMYFLWCSKNLSFYFFYLKFSYQFREYWFYS